MKNSFTERTVWVTLLLGFSSGLPLALSSSTLQAWYAKSSISLQQIGFLGLASFPYTFKFLWAPFMDRWVPPFLGRRRGWILIFQLTISLILGLMSLLTPLEHPQSLFGLACLLAFLSASQDIAINAYTTDILSDVQRSMGAAMSVNGYRIAMLVSGGLALIVAEEYGWDYAYLWMALLMLFSGVVTLCGKEPKVTSKPPARLRDCTILPFLDFLKRPQAFGFLSFIVLYKLGDSFAGLLTQTFLIQAIQMSLTKIGVIAKNCGFIGTVAGTTLGALLVLRWGWFYSLLWFGIVQALSNLLYMLLLWTGPNHWVVGSAILIENLCGGMSTAAFTGLLMGLCNHRFSAFQFALLSSLSAVGRVWIAPLFAGYIAHKWGWMNYFISSLILSIPGLILLFFLKNSITTIMTAHHASKP